MAGTIFSDINPTTTSGTDLATLLNSFKDAYRSNLKGTTRPTNISAGGFWIDSTLEASPDYLVVLKMYDGADDISLLTMNVNTNTISVDRASGNFTIVQISADAVGPILKLFKSRIASSGQTLISDKLGQVQFIATDNAGSAVASAEISATSLNDTTATNSGGYLVFKTTDFNAASMTEKMRLYNGFLGVGEVTPTAMVHATGATGITSQSAATDNAVGSQITGRKKRTANSGKVLSSDVILKVESRSTNDAGAEILDTATIESVAVENHTTTAHGTKWNFYVKLATTVTKTLQMVIGDTISFIPATAFTALATFNAHLKLFDLGTKYTTLKSYAAMAANWDFVFPQDAGTTGQALTVKSGGGTEWTNITLPTDTRNDLVNSTFFNWERGTSLAVTNGQKKYLADLWYVKNSLGTNGVITNLRVSADLPGSKFVNSLQIFTAPTSGQTNGTELYYVFSNVDSLKYYGKTASMSCYVKALGNVNQVGIQFFYATTEVALTTAIGSETTFTVNLSTFTLGSALAQSIGTSQTVAGVIGMRVRITGVSSGNTYDVNNGFQLGIPVINLGPLAMTHQPYKNEAEEKAICWRRYNGKLRISDIVAVDTDQIIANILMPVEMRLAPTISEISTSAPIRIYGAISAGSVETKVQSANTISTVVANSKSSLRISFVDFTSLTINRVYQDMGSGFSGWVIADCDIY